MTLSVVLILLLAAGTLWFVTLPLFRDASPNAAEAADAGLDTLRELHARQQMLLAALKDLEDDRVTEKLEEADYEQLKQRLSSEAIEVMRLLDEAKQEREEQLDRQREASRPLQYPGTRRSGPTA